MANFELKGELVAIFDEQIVSEKFKKREFVIQTSDQYPQVIKFQLTQDRCGMIDSYELGENITVNFDIKGKEFVKGTETMYFNSLEAWKLKSDSAPKGGNGKPMTPVKDFEEPLIMPLNENDKPYDMSDLPF